MCTTACSTKTVQKVCNIVCSLYVFVWHLVQTSLFEAYWRLHTMSRIICVVSQTEVIMSVVNTVVWLHLLYYGVAVKHIHENKHAFKRNSVHLRHLNWLCWCVVFVGPRPQCYSAHLLQEGAPLHGNPLTYWLRKATPQWSLPLWRVWPSCWTAWVSSSMGLVWQLWRTQHREPNSPRERKDSSGSICSSNPSDLSMEKLLETLKKP